MLMCLWWSFSIKADWLLISLFWTRLSLNRSWYRVCITDIHTPILEGSNRHISINKQSFEVDSSWFEDCYVVFASKTFSESVFHWKNVYCSHIFHLFIYVCQTRINNSQASVIIIDLYTCYNCIFLTVRDTDTFANRL